MVEMEESNLTYIRFCALDSDSNLRNGWYHTVLSIFFRRTHSMDVLWTVHVLICKF